MSNENTIPVLIGAAQFTDRSNSEGGLTPVQMIAQAINFALKDTGKADRFNTVDVMACSGLTVDAKQVMTPVSGLVKNVPLAAAKEAGISASKYVYAQAGGNTPQMLVNHYAKSITNKECETVVIAGGEALHTMNLRFNHWLKFLRPKLKWKDKSGPAPEDIGDPRDGSSEYENQYSMNLPANVYPMFENALRAHYKLNLDDHRKKMGELFFKFSEVAANNPYRWFDQVPSKEQILEQSLNNRMIAFPYRKRLNSMLMVNQSAALIMTSLAKAKSLGISEDQCIYLHGYADGHDIWNVSERRNYHSSPAIKSLSQRALAMANKAIDDIATFDLYSCFPSAVQVALDAMEISHDDSRSFTLTGGLPYFGGPGNNYSMHAIAEMVKWARENPSEFGLVNANGWYLTKHSVGIYSQQKPLAGLPIENAINQNKEGAPKLNTTALGPATIETYTVIHNKQDKPTKGIIIARDANSDRCLATCDNSESTLERLTQSEGVGIKGQLTNNGKQTVFEF